MLIIDKFKMVERSTNRALNNIDLIEQMKIEVSPKNFISNSDPTLTVLDQTINARLHRCTGHLEGAAQAVSERYNDKVVQ